jgi:single-stranded-DNA-specific exonuclease
MTLSGIKKEMFITNLVFVIAPRINAAGRMDDAKKAVSLFLERDYEKAKHFASLLQEDNRSRKEMDVHITEDAIQQIESNLVEENKRSIVVYSPDWHKGVIGIVASRLIERFFKPTIVLTKSGDLISGSARSIPGFNIHDGLTKCKDLLLGFGGHYYAAGMTLIPENINLFKEKFEEIVSLSLRDEDYIPTIEIDAEVKLSDLTPSFYNILLQMEPFGPENQRPIFCVRNLIDKGSKIVKEAHVRFQVEQNGSVFSGICFNQSEKYKRLDLSQPIDLVFSLEENVFNGNVTLQLKVIDFAQSSDKK